MNSKFKFFKNKCPKSKIILLFGGVINDVELILKLPYFFLIESILPLDYSLLNYLENLFIIQNHFTHNYVIIFVLI